MGAAILDPGASRSVTGTVIFATGHGAKPVNETFEANLPIRKRSGETESHAIPILDGRPLNAGFSIETNGFVLVPHPTAVRDFLDPAELKAVYYREIEELVQAVSGARRVHIFDHTLRTGSETEREVRKLREPVLWAHNDYTDWSGPQRLRDLLPDEAEALLERRMAIIQVWRPIALPVRVNPLAMVDARTVAPDDLVPAERRFPDRVGETYQLKYSPAQRWYYFPEMRREEAIVFKVYDSEKDGRARFTPHSSFTSDEPPTDAPPRQSIEVRTLAFF